jgi:hypothetical protein
MTREATIMAYRDAETESGELLQWILALEPTEVWRLNAEPVTAVVAGRAGYMLPEGWRPRERSRSLQARLAAWTC